MLDGTWKSHSIWWGFKEGAVAMAPYGPAVPEDVRAAADATHKGILDGTLHPFTGPIKNQAGETVVAAGESLDDGALLGMDWYVEGVQGKLPK